MSTLQDNLQKKFEDRSALIGVLGMGYVGLPLAVIFADAGFNVVGIDPDERTIPALAERFGVERFLWASDFPHADHTPAYVNDLNELVAAFPEDQQEAFIGGNARRLFGI